MAALGRLTALGLYKAVLHELDKSNSASFTVTQFNYYANSEQVKLYNDLADLFEQTQKLSDLLRLFVKDQVFTGTTGTNAIEPDQQVELPSDYEHALKANCFYAVLSAFGAYKQGETIQRTAKRLTADQQEFIEQPNYYLRPTFDRVYRRVVGTKLEILSGIHSRLQLKKIEFQYLRRVDEVILYESDVADLTNDNSQVLLWTSTATFMLVKYIVLAFMEQTGNQRLGNYAGLNKNSAGAPPAQAQQAQAAQRATAADQQAAGQ